MKYHKFQLRRKQISTQTQSVNYYFQ